MNFILFNKLFEAIIIYFICINILAKLTFDIYRIIKNKKFLKHYFFDDEIDGQNTETIDNTSHKISIFIIILSTIVIMFLLKFINSNTSFNALITLLIIIIAFILTINDIFNNKFGNENKLLFYFAGSLVFIFLSSETISFYFKLFNDCSNQIKEIIIICIINIKIMCFIFILLVNFNILIIFINKALKLLASKISIKLKFVKRKKKNIYFFDSYIKHKTNIYFILDCIIFLLFFPFILLRLFSKNIYLFTLKSILKLINRINLIYVKHNYIIIKLIKISAIFSLVISNIIIFYNNFFSDKIINTFNFISTVILIPLIYDQIKE